jgi:hypothetical protein
MSILRQYISQYMINVLSIYIQNMCHVLPIFSQYIDIVESILNRIFGHHTANT